MYLFLKKFIYFNRYKFNHLAINLTTAVAAEFGINLARELCFGKLFYVKLNLKTSKLSNNVQLVICTIMLQSFFYLDCGVWAFSELESFLCLRKTVYLILHTRMDGEVSPLTQFLVPL